MHAYVRGFYQPTSLLCFARTCDRYSDFLARHKRLVRTLLDQGFRYGLLCRKFKQFYRSHISLVQRYSHSVTQHLREGVDSQVRWWHIHILLVGVAVTRTDRLSIYPFTGVCLAFSSFFPLFVYRFSKNLYCIFLFFIFICYFLNLFIDFFLLSLFLFLIFFDFLPFFTLCLSSVFPALFLSSWTLCDLGMRSCNVCR